MASSSVEQSPVPSSASPPSPPPPQQQQQQQLHRKPSAIFENLHTREYVGHKKKVRICSIRGSSYPFYLYLISSIEVSLASLSLYFSANFPIQILYSRLFSLIHIFPLLHCFGSSFALIYSQRRR